jgi:hypothetical protein
MHWWSWEWLTSPKSLGGLHFRDFTLFNQAMLGKQCWRLTSEPSSLCAWVIKDRYYTNTDFLYAASIGPALLLGDPFSSVESW